MIPMSRKMAEKGIDLDVPYIVISTFGLDEKQAKIYHKNRSMWKGTISEMFDDNTRPEESGLLLDSAQAKRICNFVKWKMPCVKAIVCQCEAGISRSAAIAAALHIAINKNNNVNSYFSSKYMPNLYVFDMIEKTMKEELENNE